jgi:hypothetical protein
MPVQLLTKSLNASFGELEEAVKAAEASGTSSKYVWDRKRGQFVHRDVMAMRQVARRKKEPEFKTPKATTKKKRVLELGASKEEGKPKPAADKPEPAKIKPVEKEAAPKKKEDKTWSTVQEREGPRAIAAEEKAKTSKRRKAAPKVKKIEEPKAAKKVSEKPKKAPKVKKIEEPKAVEAEAPKAKPVKKIEKPKAEKVAAPKEPKAAKPAKVPTVKPVEKPKETPVKFLPSAPTEKPGGKVTMKKPKEPKVSTPKRLPGQGAGVMTGTTGGPQLTGQILPSTGTSTVKKAFDDLQKAYGYSTASTAPKAPKPVGAATPAAVAGAGGKSPTEGIKPSGSTGGPQLTGQTLPGTGAPKPAEAPKPTATGAGAKPATGEQFFTGGKPADKPTADKPTAEKPQKEKKDPGQFVPSGYATGAAVGRFVGAETGGSTTGGTALPQAATGIAGQAMIGRGATVRGTSMEQAKFPTRAATVSARQSPGRIGETPGRPTPTQAAMKSFQNIPRGIPGVRSFVGGLSVLTSWNKS